MNTYHSKGVDLNRLCKNAAARLCGTPCVLLAKGVRSVNDSAHQTSATSTLGFAGYMGLGSRRALALVKMQAKYVRGWRDADVVPASALSRSGIVDMVGIRFAFDF